MSDAPTTPDVDLLTGHEEIAAHLGWTVRQTKHRDGLGELPTFRLGAGRTVYARRSTLAKHFAAQEAAARTVQVVDAAHGLGPNGTWEIKAGDMNVNGKIAREGDAEIGSYGDFSMDGQWYLGPAKRARGIGLSRPIDAEHVASAPVWQLPVIDTAAWIAREPPARRWIVNGWLARATGGAMFGEDGVGKSLLAQQLATCVAAGRPFLGLDTTKAGALYLTCEDDELSLWQRQRAINKATGVPIDAASAMLSTLVGHLAAELGSFDEVGTFVPGPMFHGIAHRAKGINAGLIVLDNIAHLFPGHEIVRRQVVAFLAGVDQLAMQCDAAVLLLGHPAKVAGSEYSGNLGWSAHVRQRWFLSWADPSQGEGARVLKKAKANLSKRGEEVACRWHDQAFVLDHDLPDDRRAEIALVAQAGSDDEIFLACLAERTRQQRAVSELVSRTYAPKQFATMGESKGIGKDRLAAAMDRLFARD